MTDQNSPRTRRTASRRHRPAERQRIVQSARTVFAVRGFEGVSLRAIAEHAGVTHGLLRRRLAPGGI